MIFSLFSSSSSLLVFLEFWRSVLHGFDFIGSSSIEIYRQYSICFYVFCYSFVKMMVDGGDDDDDDYKDWVREQTEASLPLAIR